MPGHKKDKDKGSAQAVSTAEAEFKAMMLELIGEETYTAYEDYERFEEYSGKPGKTKKEAEEISKVLEIVKGQQS